MTLSLGTRVLVIRGPLVCQPGVLVNRFYHGVQVLLDDGIRLWMDEASIAELERPEDDMGEVPIG